MVSLNWTPNALQKLGNILTFLDKHSEIASKTLLNQIKKQLEILKAFPKIGRIVPERNNQELREIFIQNYRFLYCFSYDTINIITVLHFKQNFNLK